MPRSAVPLAQQPVVQLQDANGNPVSQTGVVVTATVSPTGATASNATATTAGNGAATFSGLTLSGAVGSYTLSFGGGTGLTPASSAAIALSPGAAATIARNAGGESAPVGTAVTPPPSVIVKDASGNPVAGVTVNFAVQPGSGTGTPPKATTGAHGSAAATSWTLGPTAGTNTLTATSGTLAGSPVTFTATGTAGAANKLALTTAPSSTAQSGATLAPQPVVQLQDANGNPVSQGGVLVTATLSPAGATASNNTATTDPNDAATVSSLTLAGTVASYTLSFGGTGITPVSSGPIEIGAGEV